MKENSCGIATVWMGMALLAGFISIRFNLNVALVVIDPHGHSRIARFFLGSTSDRVSEHCHCSVLIVK